MPIGVTVYHLSTGHPIEADILQEELPSTHQVDNKDTHTINEIDTLPTSIPDTPKWGHKPTDRSLQ